MQGVEASLAALDGKLDHRRGVTAEASKPMSAEVLMVVTLLVLACALAFEHAERASTPVARCDPGDGVGAP